MSAVGERLLPRRDGAAPARVPDVVLVLTVYAVTRLWAALLIVRASERQLPSIWTGPRSGYLDLAQLWDAQWYKIIAESGYPDPLPVDPAGNVHQNAWAFTPGFPLLVRAVMAVTGLPFAAAGVLLNVLLGAAAVVVLFRLIEHLTDRRVALGAVALVCTFPVAPVLQIAYSESLALLLVALACWWLVRRRYWLAAGAVLALSLSRPVVAPFGLVVLTHLVVRLRARDRDEFPTAERVQVVLLGLVAVGSTLLWPLLVGVLTGVPDAYERTQGAWRSSGRVQPFEQSLGIVRLLWGERGPWYLALGALALVAVVLSPWGRRLGPELQTWSLAYPAYLVAVTEPWTSTFRYLLLAFPLGVVAVVALRSRWLVVLLALAGMALQVRWVEDLLVFVPPTDYPP